MTVDTPEAPAEPVTEPLMVPVKHDDDTPLDDIRQAIVAVPVALIGVANTATIAGATAWQMGGATGLAGAAAAVTGTAGAAYAARRAHLAEARRRAEEDAKPPQVKQAEAKAAAAKAAQEAAAKTTKDRLGSLAKRPGARGQHRAPGGPARSLGLPAALRSGGAPGRSGPKAGPRSAGGAMRRLAAKGAALKGAAKTGAPTLGRTAGGTSARSVPGGTPKVAGRRGTSSGGALSGVKSLAGGLRRTGASAAGAAKNSRPAVAGRKAAAAGAAKLGKGTHAVTGSTAGQKTTSAGRRVAGLARSAAGSVKRAHQTGRAAIAGAAKARGQSPRTIAKAARKAAAASQTPATSTPSRAVRLRRLISRHLAAEAIAGGVLASRAATYILRRITTSLDPRPGPLALEVAARHVSPTIRQPATRHTPTPQGGAMATFGRLLHDLSAQMAAAAGSYEPEGMLEWGSDIEALEGILANIADVLGALERGADDLPVHPAVRGTLGTVMSLQASCASAAAEIHTTFRSVHADDLDRLENPRPNEHKWDATHNAGAA